MWIAMLPMSMFGLGSGCGSARQANPAMIDQAEPVLTAETAIGHDSPEGVIITEHLGPKNYSEAAVAVLMSDHPLQRITIDDHGALRAFAVYDAPVDLQPNVQHRFDAVQPDDSGRFLHGWPENTTSQDCILVVTVDTSFDPPVTLCTCSTEDCAPPKVCQLKQRPLLGTWVYVCDSDVIPP